MSPLRRRWDRCRIDLIHVFLETCFWVPSIQHVPPLCRYILSRSSRTYVLTRTFVPPPTLQLKTKALQQLEGLTKNLQVNGIAKASFLSKGKAVSQGHVYTH